MQPVLAMTTVWMAEKVSCVRPVGGSVGRGGITGYCFHCSCLQHNLIVDIPSCLDSWQSSIPYGSQFNLSVMLIKYSKYVYCIKPSLLCSRWLVFIKIYSHPKFRVSICTQQTTSILHKHTSSIRRPGDSFSPFSKGQNVQVPVDQAKIKECIKSVLNITKTVAPALSIASSTATGTSSLKVFCRQEKFMLL